MLRPVAADCSSMHWSIVCVWSFRMRRLGIKRWHKVLCPKTPCEDGKICWIWPVRLGMASVTPQQMWVMFHSPSTRPHRPHLLQLNWYSKRLIVAAIYKSSEIYMLQDQTPDKTDTIEFLERRLSDFQTMGSVRNSVTKSLSDTTQIATGLLSVVRNLTSRRWMSSFSCTASI